MAEKDKVVTGTDPVLEKPIVQADIHADGTKVSDDSVVAARRPLIA
mgnify:CR=1 FL=1